MTQRVKVVENILNANDRLAAENRKQLDQAGVFSLNFMASPGAGKTSLIEITLKMILNRIRVGVIDGDIATSLDADRAAAAGATAIQINTGGECHLDAVMLQQALNGMNLQNIDLLVVENVGNLVCPISFKLGTHKNVLIASIPEGDDKPYKYPAMYRGVDVLVINKIDLLPYIDFDMVFFKHGIVALNPSLLTFTVSCRTGEGIGNWIEWLIQEINTFQLSTNKYTH